MEIRKRHEIEPVKSIPEMDLDPNRHDNKPKDKIEEADISPTENINYSEQVLQNITLEKSKGERSSLVEKDNVLQKELQERMDRARFRELKP